MIGRKVSDDEIRAKAPRRIQTGSRIEYPRNMGDKERKANCNGRKESSIMSFDGGHKDYQNELRSQEHFDEEPSRSAPQLRIRTLSG
jgi:DNA modification methylase